MAMPTGYSALEVIKFGDILTLNCNFRTIFCILDMYERYRLATQQTL